MLKSDTLRNTPQVYVKRLETSDGQPLYDTLSDGKKAAYRPIRSLHHMPRHLF